MQKLCLYFLLAAGLSVGLGACKALQPVDDVATMQVENASYLTEAVQMDQTGSIEQVNLQSTVVIHQTEIAVVNAINQQLLATLSVRVTPTPPLVGETQPDDMGLYPNVPSNTTGNTTGTQQNFQTPYVVTGVSTQIDEDTGCVINPQTAFSGEVPRVYATFVAYSLKQGTDLQADWYREADQVASGSWTADADYDSLCIWFYIQQPQDVAFTPGNWSVRLFADTQQIGNTLPFTFEALPENAMP